MITYHNAVDTDGKIINIKEVTPESRAGHYYCVGCGAEMSAVLGTKREHHFRHKGDSCSFETYLHQLGKKVLKQRFETQKEFIISYRIQYYCGKTNNCELYPYVKCCNRKEICECDLKKEYDTCEEESYHNGFRADLKLSNSQHPEKEPIFLEIAVKHECDEKKIKSGIKIIELKINSEQDVLCPLIESEYSEKVSAVPRHRQNMVQAQPEIRVYNFEKTRMSNYLLYRFGLFYDVDGLLKYECNPQMVVGCQQVESTHYNNTILEVAMPLGKDVGINDLCGLGIALAIERKFDIRNCQICCHFNYCKINLQYVDEQTGEKRVEKYYNIQINDKCLNRFAIAYKCKNFQLNHTFHNEIHRFGKYPYWVWEKKDEK